MAYNTFDQALTKTNGVTNGVITNGTNGVWNKWGQTRFNGAETRRQLLDNNRGHGSLLLRARPRSLTSCAVGH